MSIDPEQAAEERLSSALYDAASLSPPSVRIEFDPAQAVTPRVILAIIDHYLSDPSVPLDDRRALWDVLVALRGPDRRKERRTLRHDVAAVIRATAFPATAALLGKRGPKGFRPKMRAGSLTAAAAALQERGGHYVSHAWRALLALARWQLNA